MLDLDDVQWDLGRFGKLHVRHGKGARGVQGPRERMVPLINGAGRTLRWFIEDVRGQLRRRSCPAGRPAVLLRAQVTLTGPRPGSATTTLRAALAAAARQCTCRAGRSGLTPHVLRHFCASQLYLGGMDLVAIQELPGHAWVTTTMNYIHEGSGIASDGRCLPGSAAMQAA